jgi:purine-binding chemotaxis protein CheW
MTEQHASPDAEYLCFQLGTQYFACNILQVREILQYQRPTTIPQMPGFIHGVMNLRGSVLPVIDLAQRLGHGAGGSAPQLHCHRGNRPPAAARTWTAGGCGA